MFRFWRSAGMVVGLMGALNLIALPSVGRSLTDQSLLPQSLVADNTLDDIDDQPTQLVTWVCRQGTKKIAVEVKEIKQWQASLNPDSTWQCQQNIPTIPDKTASFSCEPNAEIGLLAVYWLEGDDGSAQMQQWLNELTNKRSMVCTRVKTNPFWE